MDKDRYRVITWYTGYCLVDTITNLSLPTVYKTREYAQQEADKLMIDKVFEKIVLKGEIDEEPTEHIKNAKRRRSFWSRS